MYADKYGQFVINYAIEWDKVVTARVSTGIKAAENLRRDLDHYQKKTEGLRTGVNQVMAKGKQVDSKQELRLSRNEEKLTKARQEYNKVATDMCILIEEVTERAWKDIHPMLLKIAQFDSALSSDETKELAELSLVQEKLKKLAEIHQLKPENRLKDIETMTPSLLSTRKDEGGLRLEAGPTSQGAFGSSGAFGDLSTPLNMALPPGTVSPQGMGGFPVPITSNMSGSESVSSYSSSPYGKTTMNTSEMLAIAAAAAPPPTMEEVTDFTRNSLTISTMPTNQYSLGNLPTQNSYQRSASMPESYTTSQFPSPPASGAFGGFGRSGSVASYDADSSIASFASAPAYVSAPVAPPPPPPSSTSMYASAPAPPTYSFAQAPMSAPAPLPPAYSQPATNPWSNAAPAGQFGAPPPLATMNAYGTSRYGN